jgi:mRNA interferase MazF
MNERIFRRGDVVLIEIPFAERTDSKLRPAVIVQNDIGNRASANLIVAAISSQLPAQALPVQYIVPEGTPVAQAAGLPRASVVDCGNIYTIFKRLVRRKLGAFPREAMSQIDTCLRVSLALN